MKYVLKVNDENIRKACSLVMKHYSDREFVLRVINHGKYNHNDKSPDQVAKDLINCNIEIKVDYYKSLNPFSMAIAYAKSDTIYFNKRKFFPVIDRVETIMHESLHLMGYTHRGNYVTSYNLGTVPYKVANIFANYIMEIYGDNP